MIGSAVTRHSLSLLPPSGCELKTASKFKFHSPGRKSPQLDHPPVVHFCRFYPTPSSHPHAPLCNCPTCNFKIVEFLVLFRTKLILHRFKKKKKEINLNPPFEIIAMFVLRVLLTINRLNVGSFPYY